MDNLLYLLITNIIVFVSLICFVVVITIHVVKKQRFSIFDYILLFIFICGLYLFIPSRYVYLGFANQQPDLLKKAIKLSINPYEKRLCYKYLAQIYADDIFYQGIKDGNKAIDYMEKALNGEYDKYKAETAMLAYWYSIKGYYQKTTELNKILNTKNSLSLRNIYILNDEYDKALETFKENKSTDNFLKAALLKKTGKLKEAKEAENIAKTTYDSQMNNIKEKSKQIEFQEQTNKYKTIESYKNWLNKQKKEYKFK